MLATALASICDGGLPGELRHTAPVDEQRRQRMCTGKKRYRDEAAALQALHTMNPWGTEDGVPAGLRTYRCDYCRRWHLTSQPPR